MDKLELMLSIGEERRLRAEERVEDRERTEEWHRHETVREAASADDYDFALPERESEEDLRQWRTRVLSDFREHLAAGDAHRLGPADAVVPATPASLQSPDERASRFGLSLRRLAREMGLSSPAAPRGKHERRRNRARGRSRRRRR